MKTIQLITKFSVALAFVFMIGCANRPTNPAAIAPPIKSAAISPVAAKVKKEIVVVKESNAAIQHGLSKAIAEAERLAKQKSATEKELNQLWDTLTDVQKRAAEQWKQLETSEKTIDDLNLKASASDGEIKTLRKNLDDANARLIEAKKYQDKAAPKVAVYDWISSRLMWLTIFLVLGVIVYVTIRFLPSFLASIRPTPL